MGQYIAKIRYATPADVWVSCFKGSYPGILEALPQNFQVAKDGVPRLPFIEK